MPEYFISDGEYMGLTQKGWDKAVDILHRELEHYNKYDKFVELSRHANPRQQIDRLVSDILNQSHGDGRLADEERMMITLLTDHSFTEVNEGV